MTGEAELVGRDRELAALATALDTGGAVITLSGEPGVGKTATARAFAAMAAARDMTVLWGTCLEGSSQPPYGPWTDALAPLGPALATAGDLPPPEARLRLFATVRAALAAAAPVTVVIDDLHWASRDSLELFAHVAAGAERSALCLLGAYRDPDPALEGSTALAQLLAGLVRLPGHVRLHLRGLDAAAVGRYLSHTLGDDVPGAIVRSVRDHTGGNPFYVRAVTTALVDEGKLVHRGGRWLSDFSAAELGIPSTVRDAVRGRTAALAPTTTALMQSACLFAGDLDLATVAEVAGLPDDEAIDAVDEALATGFLQTTGRADAPYAFPHAIVRHALAESLNPDRAARLHRRAAGILERRRPRAHAAIGEQYWLSRSLPGAERGAGHCLAAADEATADHASSEAIRLLEFALELVPADAPALRTGVLERLAVAQADALDFSRAPATTLLVVDAVTAERGAALIVRVVEALRQGAPAPAYEPLVRRGMALAADRRGADWARLATVLDPVEPVAGRVLKVGRWQGYPAAAVDRLRATGLEDDEARAIEPFVARTVDETRAFLDRAIGWASPGARMRALDLAGRDFSLRHGRPDEAIECYRALLALGEEVGSLPARAEASSMLSLCLALVGELPEAEEQLAAAGLIVRDLWPGHRLHLLGTMSNSSVTGYLLGSAPWPDLAASLSRWLRSPAAGYAPFGVVFVALGAVANAFAGDRHEASLLLDELTAILALLQPHDHAVAGSLWFGTAAAWELGDVDAAASLARLVDRHLAAGGPPGPASLNHAAGRLAALLGDGDRATAEFAEARIACDRAGLRGVRALVDFDDGVVTARQEFEALGMRGWAERAAAAADRPRPAGLTAREVEVLRLLAAGHTSQEIGERLYVSLATVNRHIANIYTKIGVRNRAEATAFAIAHGLHSSV